MRIDRWFTLNAVEPLMALRLWRTRPGIPILMYHSVSADPEPGVGPYYRLAIPPSLFREHMRLLREEKYHVAGLSQVTEILDSSTQLPDQLVVLTFDDGFRDFLTNAWPILKEHELTATVFLPTAFIGTQRLTFKGRECLTWDEVRELHAHGISFGSHTVNHPRMATLPEKVLERELVHSRRVLEDELGRTVDTFAHPYAFPGGDLSYLRRYRKCMIKAGYRLAVTTTIGRVAHGCDPLMLKRLPVNGADDRALLHAKLAGGYDWIAWPQGALRRIMALFSRFHNHRPTVSLIRHGERSVS